MLSALDAPSRGTAETKARRTRSMASARVASGDGGLAKTRAQINADYFARRKQAGDKKITLWISTRAFSALQRLSKHHGSMDAAVESCLLHCDSTGQPEPDTTP